MSDPWQHPEMRSWAKRVNDELVPMVEESAIVMSLWPDPEKIDIKFAVETGLAICLDKPIVIVVTEGRPPPSKKLLQIADKVINVSASPEIAARQIAEALAGWEATL